MNQTFFRGISEAEYRRRNRFITADRITHELAIEATYEPGAAQAPFDPAGIIPPLPRRSEEIAVRLAVQSPRNLRFPNWIDFDAALPDGRAGAHKRDRHPALSLYNAGLGGYALVLDSSFRRDCRQGGTGRATGYRLALLQLSDGGGVDTYMLNAGRGQPEVVIDKPNDAVRRQVVFASQAHAVWRMEQLFQADSMPPGWRWTMAPEGMPPIVVASK